MSQFCTWMDANSEGSSRSLYYRDKSLYTPRGRAFIYYLLITSHITRNMLLVFLVWDKCLHNYWTIGSKAESRTPCPKIRPLFYLSFMALHITRNMLLVFLVWDKCLHNHCSIWSEVHSRTPSPNIQWPSKETSKSAHRLELVDVSS